MMTLTEIGNALKSARKNRKLRQADVASLAGCDQSTVSDWELGKRDFGHLVQIAQALGLEFVPSVRSHVALGHLEELEELLENVDGPRLHALVRIARVLPKLGPVAVRQLVSIAEDEAKQKRSDTQQA